MSEWMGRYRPLVSALVQHVNYVSRATSAFQIYEDIYLVPNEWQVLEYVVVHRDSNEHMNNMIHALSIPQSSFSRIQKKLCGMGLIERYQTMDNKKNIILKPTELGIKAFENHSAEMYQKLWKPFFDALEGFSDEELQTFTKALQILSRNAQIDEYQTRPALVKYNK